MPDFCSIHHIGLFICDFAGLRMVVALGSLKHRISIQAMTRTDDGLGGAEETWATETTRWANIRPLSGKELFQAQQVESKVTHEVTIRYDSNLTIDATRRILYGTRTFEIHAVINIDESNKYYKLLCSEIKP